MPYDEIDDPWVTVGSSNLDPTSLGVDYEANLFILDENFNRKLKTKLDRLIAESCREFVPRRRRASRLRRLLAAAAYHLTRRMATWGRRAVRRHQRVRPV